MAPPEECDYLVVGGGSTGLAFADSFLEHCDDRDRCPPKVVVMDRRSFPGGQWNDGYSFVRLHQPSAGYGVETMKLEPDGDDGTHLATRDEVLEYYGRVVEELGRRHGLVFVGGADVDGAVFESFEPGSRVSYTLRQPDDGEGGHEKARKSILVRRKVVDARLLQPDLPAVVGPKFDVPDENILCIPVNDVDQYSRSKWVVIGGGKTGMDCVHHLLTARRMTPDDVLWVVPNDAWITAREDIGNCMEFLRTCCRLANAEEDPLTPSDWRNYGEDFFQRGFLDWEREGKIYRLDPNHRPTKFKDATLSRSELQILQLARIIRRGRVMSIRGDGGLVFEDGSAMDLPEGWSTDSMAYVHCSAGAFNYTSQPVGGEFPPVFSPSRIVIQDVYGTPGFCFVGSVIGRLEAEATLSDAYRNATCSKPEAPASPPGPLGPAGGGDVGPLNEGHGYLQRLSNLALWVAIEPIRQWLPGHRLFNLGHMSADEIVDLVDETCRVLSDHGIVVRPTHLSQGEMRDLVKEMRLAIDTGKPNLVDAALSASKAHPDSDIELAQAFMESTCPYFNDRSKSNDRLVKVGRCVRSLLDIRAETDVEKSLGNVVRECSLMVQPIKVPKVRFGKTGIQMPIVSLGCMRFQQQWGDKVKTMNLVYSDCQDNLLEILKRALHFGINHIETARTYGSSELQLGCALKQLFNTSTVKREDLIIQSKVPVKADPEEFRATIEMTFKNLQVDYLDLFAFHGLNGEWQWDWLFGGDVNCWTVIQEYKEAGKVRHIGFSTHGPTDFINKLIETEKFEYVNLHHHFCGSYTASGCGDNGEGNLSCLRLMKKLDMGSFVISGYDKGGKVYAPSRKLRSLTLPDLEPMTYGSAWLWNHHELDDEKAEIHTFSVGAARAADLDQPAVAAWMQGRKLLLEKVKTVQARLEKAKLDALGSDWVETCYTGIVKSVNSKYLVEHNQMIWMYNVLKAWGLHAFCQDRYKMLHVNTKSWDPNKTLDEVIDKAGRSGWGYCPGMLPDPAQDYFLDDLAGVPEKNRARVKEAYEFVIKWCSPPPDDKAKGDAKSEAETPPGEWATSYEMKPWKDFPDRPYP